MRGLFAIGGVERGQRRQQEGSDGEGFGFAHAQVPMLRGCSLIIKFQESRPDPANPRTRRRQVLPVLRWQ